MSSQCIGFIASSKIGRSPWLFTRSHMHLARKSSTETLRLNTWSSLKALPKTSRKHLNFSKHGLVYVKPILKISSAANTFNRDHGTRRSSNNFWQSGLLHMTSHSMRLRNPNSWWWWILYIALVVCWRFRNARASSIMWWRWVRTLLKDFAICSRYVSDIISALPCDVLIIMVETQGEGLPFAWCMDIKQSTCVLGHCCALHDQWWRSWFVCYTFTPWSCIWTNTHPTEELLINFQELIGEHSRKNMAEAVWVMMELYGLIGKVSFQAIVLCCILWCVHRSLLLWWIMQATTTL